MKKVSSRIVDLTDAYTYAIRHVKEFPNSRWFGWLGNGTFYCDCDTVRWFPEIRPIEAIGSLTAEFGEGLTDGLSCTND